MEKARRYPAFALVLLPVHDLADPASWVRGREKESNLRDLQKLFESTGTFLQNAAPGSGLRVLMRVANGVCLL